MEIFQIVQKNFESARIKRDRVPFDLVFESQRIFAYTSSTILVITYTFSVAETLKQYVEMVLLVEMSALLLIVHLSFRYHSQTIFRMIDDLEQGINKSEWKMWYFMAFVFLKEKINVRLYGCFTLWNVHL